MEIVIVRLNWITNCRSDPFMKLCDSSALLSGSIRAVMNSQNKILHWYITLLQVKADVSQNNENHTSSGNEP
jgi:hypothetical protein